MFSSIWPWINKFIRPCSIDIRHFRFISFISSFLESMMSRIVLLSLIFFVSSIIGLVQKEKLWWWVSLWFFLLIYLIFCFLSFQRNIGLESSNENILSSYTFADSASQYEIQEDSSLYCQTTLNSLTLGQKQICLLHVDHMPIVIQGISQFELKISDRKPFV